MSSTPPGWYDDGRGTLRWWDGVRWTEHVQPVPTDAAEPAGAVAEQSAEVVPEPVDPGEPMAAQPEQFAELGFEQAPAESLAAPTAPDATDIPVSPAAPDAADTTVSPAIPEVPTAPLAPEAAAWPVPPTGAAPAYPPIPDAAGGYPLPPYSEAPAPEPKKSSKLWIVWVVIGVVALGLVIGAIVAIPLIIGNLLGGAGSAEPSGEDERAAVEAVELWDEAWDGVDCDDFFEATTENLRSAIQLEDCAAFEEQAQYFTDTTDEYEVELQSIERDGDMIIVTTTETYLSLVDEDGETLDSPEQIVEQWEYHTIESGDGWAIDDVFTE